MSDVNSYTTGEVTHFNIITHEDDYKMKAIIKFSENSFAVVKWKEDLVEVKSVKFWNALNIEQYALHNSDIVPVTDPHITGLSLEKFLVKYDDITENDGYKKNEIIESTIEFHKTMELVGIFKYHSVYGDISKDADGERVRRIAFESDCSLNSVVKLFNNDDIGKSNYFSIKFDATDISDMAKEWNMEEIELDEQTFEFLESVKSKVDQSTIPENPFTKGKEDPVKDMLPTKITKFKSKMFDYSNITPAYFVIGNHYRIVLTIKVFKEQMYAIWDVLGGEDHRVTLSSKPFDITQPVAGQEETWNKFIVTEDEFIESIEMTTKDIKLLFSSHCAKWERNMNAIKITRV